MCNILLDYRTSGALNGSSEVDRQYLGLRQGVCSWIHIVHRVYELEIVQLLATSPPGTVAIAFIDGKIHIISRLLCTYSATRPEWFDGCGYLGRCLADVMVFTVSVFVMGRMARR